VLYGRRAEVDLLLGEGLDAIVARHRRLAEGVRAAVRAWGLKLCARAPKWYSDTVSAILVPDGKSSAEVIDVAFRRYNLSLGAGLGRLAGKLFRIGHLGDLNELMLLRAIARSEMALRAHRTAALSSAAAFRPPVPDRWPATVLGAQPLRTRILANYGVGFNHIDTAAAKARGLVVTNTPDVLTDDTADDAVLLMLMVARRAGEGERHVRAGAWTGWRPTHLLGTRVSGKTLGLIGLGRIGRAVAHRARHGFGMRVVFHDPSPPPAGVVAALAAAPRASRGSRWAGAHSRT